MDFNNGLTQLWMIIVTSKTLLAIPPYSVIQKTSLLSVSEDIWAYKINYYKYLNVLRKKYF